MIFCVVRQARHIFPIKNCWRAPIYLRPANGIQWIHANWFFQLRNQKAQVHQCPSSLNISIENVIWRYTKKCVICMLAKCSWYCDATLPATGITSGRKVGLFKHFSITDFFNTSHWQSYVCSRLVFIAYRPHRSSTITISRMKRNHSPHPVWVFIEFVELQIMVCLYYYSSETS